CHPMAPIRARPVLLTRTSCTLDVVKYVQVRNWEVVRYRGEGSIDITAGFRGGDTSTQETQHSTFTFEFDDPGPGQQVYGKGTFSVSSTSSFQGPQHMCSTHDSKNYQMIVTVDGGDGAFKLGMVVRQQPQL